MSLVGCGFGGCCQCVMLLFTNDILFVVVAQHPASNMFSNMRLRFYEHLRYVFFTPLSSSSEGFEVVVHSIRQDATITFFGGKKLGSLQIESAFLDELPSDEAIASGQMFARMRVLRRLSDVLPIEDGTGYGTVSMTLKQLEALGCPTWIELQLTCT